MTKLSPEALIGYEYIPIAIHSGWKEDNGEYYLRIDLALLSRQTRNEEEVNAMCYMLRLLKKMNVIDFLRIFGSIYEIRTNKRR